MEEKDFYKILGVDRGATDDELKKAYRRLAHEFHPDKHSGDKGKEEKFKLINEAYETLKDPEKRARYDRFGYAGAGAGQGGYRDAGFGADFQDIFGEVFSEFFGGGGREGGRGRSAAERGDDLRYDLEVSFEDAVFGAEKAVRIPRTINCSACSGTGAKQGTHPAACPACKGMGQVRYQQGFFSIVRPCGTCSGTGAVIKDPCHECRGAGRTKTTSSLTVKIPPGVDTGSRLRLAGEGEHGIKGGPPGDLYIFLNVAPHQIFKRDNDDIVCEVPVSFSQAALGAEIEVPTIEGPVRLKVPPGTQSGKLFRLKGKGAASLQTGRRGDARIVVSVETPTKLDKRQRELLEEFASISGEDTTPLKKNFFSKVREIFE
ncbi:MAG: molecular chaperone DnaJ [Deltaproteobacteria bacterium]|nr:molecular chaperone DnaJ [Deltaproteobacteria bacterium]